ncbi:MAG: OmpH family outer membrane protein [Bacillota bacterium]
MQKILLWILLGLAALAIIFSAAGFFSVPKYGMVNMQEILDSAKGKEYQDSLKELQKKYQDQFAAEVKGMTDQSKIAEKRYLYEAQFNAKNQEISKEFGKQVDKSVAEVAKKRGLAGVFTKEALRYSKYDITDDVVEKLD